MATTDTPKKQQNRKPTLNQKKVVDKILEQVGKGGRISIRKAMRDSGVYSKSVSKNPQKLTRSRTFKELLEQYLPDSFLTEKHKALLQTPQLVKIFDKDTGTTTVEATEFLDVQAVKAGLDMAYKLKGHYEPEKHALTHSVTLRDLFNSRSDE